MSNPDRFAPLLLDARARTDYLQAHYLVEVDRQVDEEDRLTVHFDPPTGAGVTVTATIESVPVEAGALYREMLPDCSCDACDETAETEAARLEGTVLGIAAGGLQELYPVGRRRWVHTRLQTPDGATTPDRSRHGLRAAAATLQQLDGGWWPAWPLRLNSSPAGAGAGTLRP